VSERLLIAFASAEGAVVRMLGLIERRGYSLRTVSMEASAEGASMMVEAGPRGRARNTEVLARQLARLVDVQSVSILTPGQDSPA